MATDVAGVLDYYYERVVRLVAHQEGVHEDKTPMLTQDELRLLSFQVSPVLIDAQQTRTRLALVFGEGSPELLEYDNLTQLVKDTIDKGLGVTRSGWVNEGKELRANIREINELRNSLRHKLIKGARFWAVMTRPFFKDRFK